jgi:hypothetical protein
VLGSRIGHATNGILGRQIAASGDGAGPTTIVYAAMQHKQLSANNATLVFTPPKEAALRWAHPCMDGLCV